MQWLFAGSFLLAGAVSAEAGKTIANQAIDQTLSAQIQLNSEFGRSVAYIGDANGDGFGDLLVGQPLYDNGANNDAGAAYLFAGTATGFNTTPIWQVQPTQASARFGSAVAGVGDVNGDGFMDFAVAAEFYDNDRTDEGGIFVYLGGPTPSTTHVALLEGNQDSAYLGTSLAGIGDMNGDGFADIVGGAPGLDSLATNGGAAMVWFGGAGNGFNSTVDVAIEGPGTDYRVGASVASAGDMNADGFADLITGAVTASLPETNEGIALVYFGGSTVNTVADLTLQLNQANADFGRSVSGGGDLNGDGYSDVIVGAPLYDDGQTNEGGALVYFGGATPNAVADLTITSDQANALLGFRVASIGDADGDGYADFTIAAPMLDEGAAADAGRVFMYRGRAGSLTATPDAAFTTAQAGHQLGRSLAGGDYNRDGYADLFIGIPLSNQGATAGAGSVAVVRGAMLMPDTVADLTIEGSAAGVGLGTAIATGDLNGDGFVELVVGKPKKNVSTTEDGSFTIYFGGATGLQLANQVTVDATAAEGNLGNALAIGDLNSDGYADLAVGAKRESSGQLNEGVVYVYFGGAGAFNTTADRVLQGDITSGQFGYSLAFAGDVNGDGFGDLIVGAPFQEQGENDEGIVSIFFGGADMDVISDVQMQADQGSAFLGQSVAGVGDFNGDGFADVAAGANGLDFNATNAGGAYVWFGGRTMDAIHDRLYGGGQGNARMGFSVTAVGDVNGDGFDDFVAAANELDVNQTDTGGARLFLGAASPPTAAAVTLAPAQAGAGAGRSVGSAGDLNDDGYADIVVGASGWDEGASAQAGAAFVYLGGPGAFDTTVDLTFTTTTASVEIGHSLTSGDFDGDGDADLAIGGIGFSNGDAGEGAVFVYRTGAIGRLSSPQSFSITPLAPVEQWGRSQVGDGFYVGMEGISPRGREKGKLEIETCPSTRPFGAAQCARFVYATWSDIGSTGSPAGLGAQATGLAFNSLQHWRARVLYAPFSVGNGGALDPISAEVGPWRRMHAEAVLGDVRVTDGFFSDGFE